MGADNTKNINIINKKGFIQKFRLLAMLAPLAFATMCISFVDTIVPKIHITVVNVDGMNAVTGGGASQLWAATTRYETSGYEFEKVKLERNGGIFEGELPVKYGTTDVSIIVWDDVHVIPNIYGGQSGWTGSKKFTVIPTEGYYSPCPGAVDSTTSKPLYQLLVNGILPFNLAIGNGTIPNEAYIYTTGTADGSISVDWMGFAIASTMHCRCSAQVVQMLGPYNTLSTQNAVASDWWVGSRFTGGGLVFFSVPQHATATVNVQSGTIARNNLVPSIAFPGLFITDTNGSITSPAACVKR